MKFAIILLGLMSFSLYAQVVEDASVRMNKLLIENHVIPWGKRKFREATIICKVPKGKELFCSLRSSGGAGDFDIYEEIHGQKAVEVSNLLKEYNVFPQGNRQRQDIEVECKLNKGTEVIRCASIINEVMGF